MNDTAYGFCGILSAAWLLWNLITFLMMGIDKRRAVRGGWRIPEKRLFACAFLFGGVGIALGMTVLRHKTKHMSFRILIPLSVVVNGVMLGMIFYRM